MSGALNEWSVHPQRFPQPDNMNSGIWNNDAARRCINCPTMPTALLA